MIPSQVVLTGLTVPTGFTLNATGTITIAPLTPAGTYSIIYRICEVLNPTNCDTVTTTVTIAAAVIDAVADTFGPINGYTGSTTASVLANDTLNGVLVIPSQVVLTGLTVPTGFTLNATGTITIAPLTPAGTYSIIYRICEVLNPTNCDTVTTTVTVGGCLDFAINDCDNDGENNGTEAANGTNPNDICSYTTPPALNSSAYVSWSVLDCDGDGVTNGQELIDGTNPLNSCSLNPLHQTTTTSSVWNNSDCDGDGVTNGQEIADNSNLLDPCSLIIANQSLTPSTNWLASDCDGDGVTNGQEIIDGTDVKDSCDSNSIHVTLGLSPGFLNGDCDSDGILNGEEIGANPSNPNDFDNNNIPDYLELNNHAISEDDLEVYNAVTPNGNGDNDVFVIRNIQLYPNNTVTIFNRWGVIVYEVDSYGQNNKYFKGISEGRSTIRQSEELPIGTYFYSIRYVNSQGLQKTRSGYLYLNK